MKTKKELKEAIDLLESILSDYAYTHKEDWEAYVMLQEHIDNLKEDV